MRLYAAEAREWAERYRLNRRSGPERDKKETHTRIHAHTDGTVFIFAMTLRHDDDNERRTTNGWEHRSQKKHAYMQYTPITAIDDDIYAYKENAAL